VDDVKMECQSKMKDEIKRLTDSHSREMGGMKARYEAQIKDLESNMNVTRSLQEQGSTEVGNLIKKLGEATERHSKDLRATRERYEAEISELKVANRQLESAAEKYAVSLPITCDKCNSMQKSLQENEQSLDELKTKHQDLVKSELKLRGELAQSKQLMTITQANEKLLEDHVASLEAQIEALVNDYETKLSHV
jgi:chromosome segregation ATPase